MKAMTDNLQRCDLWSVVCVWRWNGVMKVTCQLRTDSSTCGIGCAEQHVQFDAMVAQTELALRCCDISLVEASVREL